MYRFLASRRPRFPPFRQEGPEWPVPPQSPPRAVLCSGEHTKHTVLRTIFDTMWGPQSSPPPFPCLGRARRRENHQKHKGKRGSRESKSLPAGCVWAPNKSVPPKPSRNLRRPASKYRSRRPLSNHALRSARDDDFGLRTKMRGHFSADAFCKTGPPLAPGPG